MVITTQKEKDKNFIFYSCKKIVLVIVYKINEKKKVFLDIFSKWGPVPEKSKMVLYLKIFRIMCFIHAVSLMLLSLKAQFFQIFHLTTKLAFCYISIVSSRFK